MYVKFMHSYSHNMHGENDFSILEVHKGQRISFWQSPGKGMEIQLIENDAVLERHAITGAAYVMNEQGKTIATYGNSLQAFKTAPDDGSIQSSPVKSGDANNAEMQVFGVPGMLGGHQRAV